MNFFQITHSVSCEMEEEVCENYVEIPVIIKHEVCLGVVSNLIKFVKVLQYRLGFTNALEPTSPIWRIKKN